MPGFGVKGSGFGVKGSGFGAIGSGFGAKYQKRTALTKLMPNIRSKRKTYTCIKRISKLSAVAAWTGCWCG